MCRDPSSPQSRDSLTDSVSAMYCTVNDGIDLIEQSLAQLGTRNLILYTKLLNIEIIQF